MIYLRQSIKSIQEMKVQANWLIYNSKLNLEYNSKQKKIQKASLYQSDTHLLITPVIELICQNKN